MGYVSCLVLELTPYSLPSSYHSPEDTRLPDSYVCVPCRLQADANFHLIKDAYADILRAFMDLALFRYVPLSRLSNLRLYAYQN